MIIAGSRKFMPLNGDQAILGYDSANNIDYDLAVVEVPPQVSEELERWYDFIVPTDIADIDEYSKSTLYAFVGYPCSRNREKIASVRRVTFNSYYFLLREFVDIQLLQFTEGKHSTTHFALCAELKKIRDINFELINPIKPNGISGGGVWKITLDARTSAIKECSLVGIGVEYHKAQNAFIATRIGSAITAQYALKGNS